MNEKYYVYVVNQGSGTVSIIDSATNTVVKTLTVGENPNGFTITPDKKTMYVYSETSQTRTVIDLETNTVTDTETVTDGMPFGEPIRRIVVDERLRYEINVGMNTVTVFDIRERREIQTITVGDEPVMIGFIPLIGFEHKLRHVLKELDECRKKDQIDCRLYDQLHETIEVTLDLYKKCHSYCSDQIVWQLRQAIFCLLTALNEQRLCRECAMEVYHAIEEAIDKIS